MSEWKPLAGCLHTALIRKGGAEWECGNCKALLSERAPDARPSDAADFRAALLAFEDAVDSDPQDRDEIDTARARVLALYAERQGEEGVVVARIIPTRGWPEVVVRLRKDLGCQDGDRVRVSRVEAP